MFQKKNRPRTLKAALTKCCFRSFSILLKVFATILLSSCSHERSTSALRRLNNYLRFFQTEQRLSALALMHMNYDTDIDIDNVWQIICNKHLRRIVDFFLIIILYFNMFKL